MSKPIIAVTGATGAQGGSVVRFLLQDGGFQVRALTRNVDSDAAKALAEKGVELVKADFNDKGSLEAAFTGAYGVFGNTDYWQPDVLNEEKEFSQAKNLVDAAKAAGVKHYVYSTLEQVLNPPGTHCNSKYRANNYLVESGIPRTSIYTSFYFENFTSLIPVLKSFQIKPNAASPGSYVAGWPVMWSDGPIPGYAVEDTGAFVVAAFKDPGRWIGKDIKILGDIFTPRQFVEIVREVSGKTVEFKETSFEEFDASDDGGLFSSTFCATMKSFYRTDGWLTRTTQEIEVGKSLYPELKTLRKFVEENIDQILR